MNALHPLGQLIQSVEDSKGWTVREIARRIERAELNLSNAYLGKLKRKPITAITYDTIHALSVGLDLPERVVGAAALEAMGVHDVNPAEAGAAVAIARDPSLSERDRRVLLAVVREMQREDEAAGEPPEPDAGSMRLAGDTQPDGVTPKPDTGGIRSWGRHRPLAQDDLDLAADHGESARAPMDEAARRRGEESQDPGTDEPA